MAGTLFSSPLHPVPSSLEALASNCWDRKIGSPNSDLPEANYLKAREKTFQVDTPQGHIHWPQKAAPDAPDRPHWWWTESKGNSFPNTPPTRARTSTGFLRLLRSLAILAFLSCFRFFSSRSLSPSLLEELAEALLSNLPRRWGLGPRSEDSTPRPQDRGTRSLKPSAQKRGGRTTEQPPPCFPLPTLGPASSKTQSYKSFSCSL